jgi:hypothetical protein
VCGIFGFSKLTSNTLTMAPYMAWEMESRGDDSWGGTDGTPENTLRIVGPITDALYDHFGTISSWDRAIFHTRGASTGAVTAPNQHPFRFVMGGPEHSFGKPDEDPGPWVRTINGIHNGIVSSHEYLNKKYSRNFEVDSMHIYAHMAAALPLSEICGWGNLAWYEYTSDHPEGILRMLCFNNDQLHICQLTTGEIVFCSTVSTIFRAAHMAGVDVRKEYDVKERVMYSIGEMDGRAGLFRTKVTVPFGTRNFFDPTPTRATVFHGGYGYPTESPRRSPNRTSLQSIPLAELQSTERREGLCAVSGCIRKVTKDRKVNLVCDGCFAEVMKGL